MPEISKNTLTQIESLLNSTINELLFGGSADAGCSELEGAASLFKTLKLLNLKIRDEEDVRGALEKNNVYNHNYIKGF